MNGAISDDIGKPERSSQERIIQLFKNELGYEYLGHWQEEERTQPIEEALLLTFLKKQGYSNSLAQRAVDKLVFAATNLSDGLYEANKKVYRSLRYGVDLREELGDLKETVHLIDWKNPGNNHFSIAEEVTVKGRHYKRPDLVLYVNGIALGVIELKKSTKSLEQGIRQNLDNQKPEFIQRFFTTMQLLMAGNDTAGMRYGTIETPEKYYLQWKEGTDKEFDYPIDKQLYQLCNKARLLELIYNFVIFDQGVKKLCRPNQYFGVKAAQKRILNRQGGIIWHTQGSGKSLIMIWLSKWIRENVTDSRVLIITDREELDDQIENTYLGVDEKIYRTKSGRDLIRVLNSKTEVLICSLVHKFGRGSDEGDYEAYIKELKASLGSHFSAKGNIHVFVDECHRTQSGKLHGAMKTILPDAMFIGFTGTPLLKKDKQKSIEVFGPYIGDPYKFDEAVADKVVLDLLYEARDVEQFVTDQQSIDEWFDAETSGLTDVARAELKKRWGTMQKVLGSKSRLEKIVFDIIKDLKIKPRLASGEGNAMLVTARVYHACKYYELFQQAGLKECAIITSYDPHHSDIKGEETGEGDTDVLTKYRIYNEMLKGKTTEEFEATAKDLFKKEPGKMKLLIVVDKLLTGFDAPSATYLYIDKDMRDHGLFQAICRVNRVDNDSKKYGYIVDYKDLFNSLKSSIEDYTSAAFDEFDAQDVSGLLKDRYELSKDRLDTELEKVIAMCEPVHPKDEPTFIHYFCGNTEDPEDITRTADRRVALYKAVVSLLRAYAEIANEMHKVGYTPEQAQRIKEQVRYYSDLRDSIKQASGDYLDFKRFEPGMRQLMDMYLDAKSSKKISDLENTGLVELIQNVAEEPKGKYGKKKSQEAVAEIIENNVRKVIVEESQTNPKYYEKMSVLLDELIRQRKEEVIQYEAYMAKIKELAAHVSEPSQNNSRPAALDTPAKRALYDNLEQDQIMALALDNVIQTTKLDGWRDGGIREKKLRIAVAEILQNDERTARIMEIVKAQSEY